MLDVQHIATEVKRLIDQLTAHARDEVEQHRTQIDALKKEVDRLKNEVQDWRVKAISDRCRIVDYLHAKDAHGLADDIERGEHEK